MHGPVYRVVHRETGEAFAMKTLSLADAKSPANIRELQNELMLMSRLDHPNIAKVRCPTLASREARRSHGPGATVVQQ